MTNLVVILEDQLDIKLKQLIKSSLKEYDSEKISKEDERLFTINQISKRLRKSHATIKKMCKAGLIKTTKSGLITEQAINDYLQNT